MSYYINLDTTVSALDKSISFVTNKSGKNEGLLIDLKNVEVAAYFEGLVDTLEAEKRINVGGGRSFSDFKKEYFASKEK